MRILVVSHTSSLKASSPAPAGATAGASSSARRKASTFSSMSSPPSNASQSSRSSRARSMKFQRLSQSIAAARDETIAALSVHDAPATRTAGIGGRLAASRCGSA